MSLQLEPVHFLLFKVHQCCDSFYLHPTCCSLVYYSIFCLWFTPVPWVWITAAQFCQCIQKLLRPIQSLWSHQRRKQNIFSPSFIIKAAVTHPPVTPPSTPASLPLSSPFLSTLPCLHLILIMILQHLFTNNQIITIQRAARSGVCFSSYLPLIMSAVTSCWCGFAERNAKCHRHTVSVWTSVGNWEFVWKDLDSYPERNKLSSPLLFCFFPLVSVFPLIVSLEDNTALQTLGSSWVSCWISAGYFVLAFITAPLVSCCNSTGDIYQGAC